MLFPFPPTSAPPPRVVITGAGIVTALGLGWKPNAEGFRLGRPAFRPVSLFDVSCQRVKTAAEVDLPDALPPTGLSRRQLARLDRAGKMLLLAANEAWQQGGWKPAGNLPLVLGTTAGGMSLGEDYFRQAVQSPGRHRRQPTRAIHYQPQVQARMVLDALDFNGPITIISNACASGSNAIGHAWNLIRCGQAERALAGGYDALSLLVFAGFDALQALSPTVCRPFDARRDGLALGEGAALVALETLEHAQRRKATILGELIGYGATIDRHHLTQPQPEGNAALAAMNLACDAARLGPKDVDYINAHGTGTVLNDSAEASAISRWAGPRAATLPVSSTKASIGHLLGAAGAVEAVICLMALREQWLPAQAAFETPDPACNFPIVRQPRDAPVKVALSNSFGFGGVNATLILRRWA
ncbi:MAG: beta-ketoacyl-[acyl-carrier-protein] synthase family protein [Verrucomicrobiota bacterium]